MVYLAADGRDRRVAVGATWLVSSSSRTRSRSIKDAPDCGSARGRAAPPAEPGGPTPAAISAPAAIDGLTRLAGLKALQ
jgi:hypothetical protein